MSRGKNFISTHDIDWFIIINEKLVHVASAGGEIPEQIVNQLDETAIYVAKLPEINNYDTIDTIGQSFLRDIYGDLTQEQVENYLFSFKVMAQKGIYSFDRTHINDLENNTYHLVAWPKTEGYFFDQRQVGDNSCPIKSIQSNRISFDAPSRLFNVDLYSIVKSALGENVESKQ